MTAERLKDLPDLQELIRGLHRSADLAQYLNKSVQKEYTRLWTAVDRGSINERTSADQGLPQP